MARRIRNKTGAVVREIVGGEPYDFIPLGEHIVLAEGVCGGRPTFKYRRVEPGLVLALLRMGRTITTVAKDYGLSRSAVEEAIRLAAENPGMFKDPETFYDRAR